jgi:hypothetical protein
VSEQGRLRGPVRSHVSHLSRRTYIARPMTYRGSLWSIEQRPSPPGVDRALHERTSSEFGFEG